MTWANFGRLVLGFWIGYVVAFVTVKPKTATRYVAVQSEAPSKPQDQYAYGYDVLLGGQIVCRDPYVWYSLKQIECR